jgi:ferredoxin
MKLRTRSERFRLCTTPDANSLGGGGPVREDVAPIVVHFAETDRSIHWDDRFESLLELAEEYDVPISAGCRYGDCSTCQTQLLSGEVVYNHATGVRPDPGYCLPCSCHHARRLAQ